MLGPFSVVLGELEEVVVAQVYASAKGMQEERVALVKGQYVCRTSTYNVSKHASWIKEWLVLGLPKDE